MVTKIKTDDDTFIARKKNETFIVDADTDLVFVNDNIGIQAAGKAGGRTIRIDGSINTPVAFSNTIQMDCSAKKVERIIVGSTGEISSAGGAISASGGLVDIRVAGKVEAGKVGVSFDAIRLNCDTATLRNSGTIEGGSLSAVHLFSGDLTMKNSGFIEGGGEKAIIVTSGRFDLTNTGTMISEDDAAILLGDGISSVGKVTIVNDGTIAGGPVEGKDVAIKAADSGPSNDVFTIVNTGEIIGNIDLSDSERNDVVDTSNGRVEGDILTGAGGDRIVLVNAIVTGTVIGGLGDDVYTISSDDITIVEDVDAGTDTVRATGNVSVTLAANFENLALIGKSDTQATGNGVDNVLTGNAGNNVIDGADGEDTIRGGKGRDELIGGADIDTFIFGKGDETDVIRDFATSSFRHDFLDLSGIKGITDFDDLIANHASDVDGDVVINAGKGDQVVLEGLTVAELRAELFFL